MKKYIPRIVDSLLSLKLDTMGAVLIRGPKWCGKTTTAQQFSKSIVYMDDPEKGADYRDLAEHSPSRLLSGEVPRLIDEWQLVPSLWDAIRFTVDRRDEDGQFILTGSASPVDDNEKHHSGTGRIARIVMRPMTLSESGESSKQVSLGGLFDEKYDVYGENSLQIDDLSYLCCRGGWPRACQSDRKKESSLMMAYEYIDSVADSAITTSDGKVVNQLQMRSFLRSYARNVGSQTPLSQMAADTSVANVSFSQSTALNYHRHLHDIFVIEEMAAWNPNLRSRTAIRTSDTRYFSDPSLAAASLGIGPDDLISDMRTFGFIFENMCVRDLRVYAQMLNGDVMHYRDKNNLECDAVIHLRNGKYGLIEVKLGGKTAIDQGAANLKKLASLIDDEKMNRPSFLMVLTGVSSFAYRREDGVCVVPLGCLTC